MIKLKTVFWIINSLLIVGLALFLLHYFIPGMPFGVANIIKSNNIAILQLHIAGGALAAITGITQFFPKFRAKNPKLHRYSGYAYCVGIGISAPAGLFMASHSQGGLVTHFGFGLLSLIWAFTTLKAIFHILKGQVQNHREWMLRSFAITFAFVTLRLWIGILMVLGGEFDQVYQTVSWLCWVPNILIIEYYIIHKYRHASHIA